jgi:hypothetical protein
MFAMIGLTLNPSLVMFMKIASIHIHNASWSLGWVGVSLHSANSGRANQETLSSNDFSTTRIYICRFMTYTGKCRTIWWWLCLWDRGNEWLHYSLEMKTLYNAALKSISSCYCQDAKFLLSNLISQSWGLEWSGPLCHRGYHLYIGCDEDQEVAPR